MATITEKSKEYANEQNLRMAYNGSCDNCRQGFVLGANYVLEEIENFMKDLDLGNSAEEKFYKLDVISDIGLFIKQLKK